jgi:hypothetical protein
VLYALRQPATLLGLILGFAVGIPIRAVLQQQAAAGTGIFGGRRRLRGVGGPARARGPLPWGRFLDPYGAVAAVVSGVGWGARVPPRAARGWRALVPLLIALIVHGLLAAVGFAAYRALGGPSALGDPVHLSDILHGSVRLGDTAVQIAAGFGAVNLGCGLLALMPIPPLELGVLVWSGLPRSAGARRFAYHLLEEAWGVVVVLVGLLLPLAGQGPVLLTLIDVIAKPLLQRV